MDDDTIHETSCRRCLELHEQMEAASSEMQAARDEIKTWKAKAWEHHKEKSRLKYQANETADVASLELCDAKEKVSSRESRIEALMEHLREVKLASKEELHLSKKENATLQAHSEALTTELQHAKEQNNEMQEELQTVKLELTIAKVRVQTATADTFAAKQDVLASWAVATKSTSNDGTCAAQYKSQIEYLTAQLQRTNDDSEILQSRLREEKGAYAKLVQSTKKELLASRSVSADLLDAYLRKEDSEGPQDPKIPTIKLREHKWTLSRIQGSPQEFGKGHES